jgi:hypothetical protein
MHEVALVEKYADLSQFEQEAQALIAFSSQFDQVELPLKHQFAPSVYLREIFMPKGTFVIGKKHKTEHFNVALSGEADVLIDGVFQRIKAPCIFKSKAGCRKILSIIEDMKWATIHPTEETDIPKLEEALVHEHVDLLGDVSEDVKAYANRLIEEAKTNKTLCHLE